MWRYREGNQGGRGGRWSTLGRVSGKLLQSHSENTASSSALKIDTAMWMSLSG